jgi:ribosomal protein S27AE
MTKEEMQEKFLKEHPKFEYWQNISSLDKVLFKDKEVEIYINDDYFKDVPKEIKNQARQILYIERRNGRIKRQPCERCGSLKVQAHHEDYSDPLNVLWLCTRHHADRHIELNRKVIKVIKKIKTGKKQTIKSISRQEGLSTV